MAAYSDKWGKLGPETPVAELVARCVAGDDTARALFVSEYGPVVRRAVLRKLRSLSQSPPVRAEADDLCQEVLERVLEDNCRRLAQLHNPDSIVFWLTTIAHRQVTNHLRRSTLDRNASEALRHTGEHRTAPAPDTLAMARESAERVRSELKGLPDAERLALELYYVHGITYSEIAQMTGRTIGVISSQIHRAKARLRKLLEGAPSSVQDPGRTQWPDAPAMAREEPPLYGCSSEAPEKHGS